MSQKPFLQNHTPSASPRESLRTEGTLRTISATFELPFFESVSAGFPSPATDYMDKKLDLNELCIQNPSATFFIRVQGDSMFNAGISDGDILIVDRSLTAKHRDVVVAIIESEFVVKRLFKQGKKVLLVAENYHYPPLVIEDDSDFEVWGVVKRVIHNV
jgi:DNA polymerase V